MEQILSPPPRRMTPAWVTARSRIRTASAVLALAGATLITLGILAGALLPISLWGLIALVAAAFVLRAGDRRLELWLHGTEMLAEAGPGKSWTLTWSVGERTFTSQTSQQPLLWDNGRVRILVDLDQPSRMVPVCVDMVAQPEAEAPAPILPPQLPSRPRRANLLVYMGARQRQAAAALAAVMALVMACILSPFVQERRRFLAVSVEAGRGRVTGRTASTVEYQFDGSRRCFAAGGKAQARWPLGSTVKVYRHEGDVVAETELPGMPVPMGVILIVVPIVAAITVLGSALSEALLARRLWREGKEVAAELISDFRTNYRREVVCRFACDGSLGVTRREFSPSRKLLEGFRGEPIVLVDRRDPSKARILLADEV